MNDKEILIRNEADSSLKNWREQEKTALELLKVVGELRFDRSIELILFRRDIYDARPSKVINDHLFATNYIQQPIKVETTLKIAYAIAKNKNIGPAKVDIGLLGAEWKKESDNFESINEFIDMKLAGALGEANGTIEAKDVVLYGLSLIHI